jgi:hypothetical protein
MWWFLLIPFALLAGLIAIVSILSWAGAWPWLLVAVGLWLIWQDRKRTRRASEGKRGRPAKQRIAHRSPGIATGTKQQGGSGAAAAPPAAPREPTPIRRAELPIDVQVKVEQIRRKIDVLLGYADRFPPMSHDLYLVRQTASEYLPRTVEAYLSLPVETAEGVFPAGTRTAREELREQLDLLDTKLDEIAQDLQRQDLDRLLANRRFLEARFKPQQGESESEPEPGTLPANVA